MPPSAPNLSPDFFFTCGNATLASSDPSCTMHPLFVNCTISQCTTLDTSYGGSVGICDSISGLCECPTGYSGVDFLAWYNDCHVWDSLREGMGATALAFNILAVIITISGIVVLFLIWGVLFFPESDPDANSNDDIQAGGGGGGAGIGRGGEDEMGTAQDTPSQRGGAGGSQFLPTTPMHHSTDGLRSTTPLSSIAGFHTSVILTMDGEALDEDHVPHLATTAATTTTTLVLDGDYHPTPLPTAPIIHSNVASSTASSPIVSDKSLTEKSSSNIGKRSSSNTAPQGPPPPQTIARRGSSSTAMLNPAASAAQQHHNNFLTHAQRSNSSQQRDMETSSARYSDAQGSITGGGNGMHQSVGDGTGGGGGGGGRPGGGMGERGSSARKRNSSRVPVVNFNELHMPPPNVHSQEYRTRVFERKKRRHSTLVLLLGLVNVISTIVVFSVLMGNLTPFESQNGVILVFSCIANMAVSAMVWLFMYSVFNPVIKNVSKHGAFLRPELGNRFLYRKMEKNPAFIKFVCFGIVAVNSIVSLVFWIILCLTMTSYDVSNWVISVMLTWTAFAMFMFWVFCWNMCSLALAIFKCELAHRLEQQQRNLNPVVRQQQAQGRNESSLATRLPIHMQQVITISSPVFIIPTLLVAWEASSKANFFFFFSFLAMINATSVIVLTVTMVSVRTETKRSYSGSRDMTGGGATSGVVGSR